MQGWLVKKEDGDVKQEDGDVKPEDGEGEGEELKKSSVKGKGRTLVVIG